MKFIISVRQQRARPDGKLRWEVTHRFEVEGAEQAVMKAIKVLDDIVGCAVNIARRRPTSLDVTHGETAVHHENEDA